FNINPPVARACAGFFFFFFFSAIILQLSQIRESCNDTFKQLIRVFIAGMTGLFDTGKRHGLILKN
ncbi:hypothetical protein, partial [Enterobacter hormaechei]